MRKKNLASSAIRFRRYSRKGYSAFASLHRVVTIGHLASYIADRQMHKSSQTSGQEQIVSTFSGYEKEISQSTVDEAGMPWYTLLSAIVSVSTVPVEGACRKIKLLNESFNESALQPKHSHFYFNKYYLL